MEAYTHIDVASNANSPMMANLVFHNLSEPVRVSKVRLFEGQPEGEVFGVTGWSSDGDGTPCDAFAVRVDDSGSGEAYLIYGGDWGVRLRPLHAKDWSIDALEQWGETHLVLADRADIFED
jgi:hypothetical protein